MHVIHDGMDVSLLKAFDALFRERHLTRAAEHMALTQSAMSHTLARMRIVWEDPLFIRTAHGMMPTRRATELAPHVANALIGMAALTAPQARFDPGKLERTFTILSSDYLEVELLPRLCRALSQQAPLVNIGMSPVRGSELEHADVAVGVFYTPPAHWIMTKLFDDEFVTVLRKNHPLLRKGLTRASYVNAGHVLIAPGGTAGGPVDAALAEAGLRRRVAVRVSSFLSACMLVSESDHVVTLPRRIAQIMTRGLAVRIVKPPIATPLIAIAMAHHPVHAKDVAHQWFRQLMRQIAQE